MTWEWSILLIYTLALGFIFFFSLIQLNLTYNFLFRRKKFEQTIISPLNLEESVLPKVTIQLPVYNEKYVIERLIDAVMAIDYPKDKLQVQVLDDSTDETTQLIQNKVLEYSAKGFQLELVRRPVREGYKAGALKYGLGLAEGKYIAIFDADFLPKISFLKDMIPYLEADEKLGVVQSRWGHLNENYSLITRLQAFALDAHFVIEQIGRNVGKHFINFNGTGGIWRKTCIYDAGNWEADTLTEDLDLSYRAQMKGWKFLYFKDLVSPAELPVTMNELKAQQRRWTKGAAETAKKHLVNLWKSEAQFSTKIHGSMHLLNSAIFVAFMLASISSVPVLLFKSHLANDLFLFKITSLFLLSMVSLTLFYGVSYFDLKKVSFKTSFQFIITFPLLLSLSMGLSLHNALAVVEGYLGVKTPFIRTPKYNITGDKASSQWIDNSYRMRKITWLTGLEGILTLYFLFGLVWGILHHDYDLLLLHSLITFGFGAIFFLSVKHAR